MSLNCLQTENFSISYEYFNYLKIAGRNILTFIKEYKSASINYNKKLKEIYNNYKNESSKLHKEVNAKQNIEFAKIFYFVNSIPKIIHVFVDNLTSFTDEIEKKVMQYESLNPDLIVPMCKANFDLLKNNLIEKGKEINNFKTSYFDSMNNTEEVIYNYYYSANKKKELNLSFFIPEEIIKVFINKTKELENSYKNKINEVRNEEDNFVKLSKFHCESVKKISTEIFDQLKHIILDFLVSLKNIFIIPQNEIDSYLKELIKLESSLKIENLMEKYYHNDKEYKYLYNPEKYDLRILKKNSINNTNNNINNNNNNQNKSLNKTYFNEIEKKVIEIDDGYGKDIYIEDENALLTLKKMKDNFELINIKMDFDIEEEKRKTNSLTFKLLSNLIKESKNNNKQETINITENEIKELENLFQKHHNQVIFLQILNRFRSTGRLFMNKKIYEIFSILFNIILDKLDIKRDKDIFLAKNIIILSQTYYRKDDKQKEKDYIQNAIINHKLFKDHKFWEELFNFEMAKEIQKLNNIDDSYFDEKRDIEEIRENDKQKYGKLAFGQIMTLSNNMIDFGLSSDEVYKVMQPKIEYFQLSPDLIETIKSVLNVNNETEEKKNINKDNENNIETKRGNDNEKNNKDKSNQ